MKTIIDSFINLVFALILILGPGYTIVEVHSLVKKEVIEQISKRPSSTEKLSNSLTGENL